VNGWEKGRLFPRANEVSSKCDLTARVQGCRWGERERERERGTGGGCRYGRYERVVQVQVAGTAAKRLSTEEERVKQNAGTWLIRHAEMR